LLPTIVFILVIYGLYLLMAAWCRRKQLNFRGRVIKERPRWLALTYGAVGLSVCLGLLFWLKPASQNHRVRLAGVLGLGEGMVSEGDSLDRGAPHLPVQEPNPKTQPAYALLHPESQPSLQAPVRPPHGTSPLRPPKTGRTSALDGKKPKVLNKQVKKDNPPLKPKAKKKKNAGMPSKPALLPAEGRS